MGDRSRHTVTLKPVNWSDAMAAAVAEVPGDADPAWCEAEMAAGRLSAWAAAIDGEPCLWLLWRVEDKELVIVVAVGRHDRLNLVDTVLPVIEAFAARAGLRSVRFHTTRPGLVRRAGAHGYHTAEIVLRKAIEHHG
jgi:hypothetical protein